MSLRVGIIARNWAVVLCSLLVLASFHTFIFAQAVEARVSSVSRGATRINHARRFNLRRGDSLAPGDEIDTRNGGRVVVELTDGSLVTIQPGSHIIFKDYRYVSSLRELFQVLIGRVRVKIAHYGGRPNPYRVNSPTASILVRGTEFLVAVNSTGETRVVVYEGLVEVESLSDPNRRALLSPGNGVLVRPNEDIRFFTPGPGSEIGERSGRASEQAQQQSNAGKSFKKGGNGTVRNYIAGDYERYIDSLAEPGESPPLMRFSAFADSHLDSLENPAYATEFNSLEGRTLTIGSLSNSDRKISGQLFSKLSPIEPNDSGFLIQNTFFMPLPDSRVVIGGNVSMSFSKMNSFSSVEFAGSPTRFFPSGIPGVRQSNSVTGAESVTGSLMVARRFGKEGRTSAGLAIDHFNGHGTLKGFASLANGIGWKAVENIQSESEIERTRLTIGFTHNFANRHKLGIYYRHGLVTADDRDVSRTFNGLPVSPDSVNYNSQSSEIGLRLRGLLTRRLFYGIEGLLLTTGLDESIKRAVIVDTTEKERISRAAISFGIGYALRPQTILSADLGVGVSHINETYIEQATNNPLEEKSERFRFLSLQTGIQSDLWRNLFASVSVFTMAQSESTNTRLSPDRYGRLLNNNGLFVPNGISTERFVDTYADFGVGWRLSGNILAEYVLAYSFGIRSPSHILLFRYSFKRE